MRLVPTLVLAGTLTVVAGAALPALAQEPAGSPDAWSHLAASKPRWNPCRVITFKVNDRDEPGGTDDVREALWRVGQASGLVFEYQGPTDFVPTTAQRVPAGTDLVVAWARHGATDAWGGTDGAGYGSARWTQGYRPDGTKPMRITDAYVVLDPDARTPPGFASTTAGGTRGELVMHEAGHAVGLGHTNDQSQIMHTTLYALQGRWGAGDLNGLAAIGAPGGCLYPTAQEATADQGSVPPQPPRPAGSTPSPAPSASPTGSTSPAPSQGAPTLTLSPGTINAGEPTTVTYRGTPGATVDILSRTQPSQVFTRIGSVVLDGSGLARSTHKPQKNTRITARAADGTMSATAPVIAVRSVASFNAGRAGVRTYTFTGRVYPALDDRLVNVYRNGTLVAQGRTDATGVYRITRTLAGGTFTFQVRTPDDQHNLGTVSRELRLLVQ